MLIPFDNCLVKSMETTFNDLKEKHQKLIASQWQLRSKLQNHANDLLQEYVESLSLPSKTWTDSQGTAHPYVSIGVWVGQGKFEMTPLPHLPMGDDYSLRFVIATVLNDSPMTGGYKHGVSVSLRYEGAILYASVGTNDDVVHIPVSLQPGGFFEVCAAIKLLISTAIDRATPTAILA